VAWAFHLTYPGEAAPGYAVEKYRQMKRARRVGIMDGVFGKRSVLNSQGEGRERAGGNFGRRSRPNDGVGIY